MPSPQKPIQPPSPPDPFLSSRPLAAQDPEAARSVFEELLSYIGPTLDAQLLISGGAFERTHFLHDHIEEHIYAEPLSLGLGLAFQEKKRSKNQGWRAARSWTGSTHTAALQALVKQTRDALKVAPLKRQYIPTPPIEKYPLEAPNTPPLPAPPNSLHHINEVARALLAGRSRGWRCEILYQTGRGPLNPQGRFSLVALGHSAGRFAFHSTTHARMIARLTSSKGATFTRLLETVTEAQMDGDVLVTSLITLAGPKGQWPSKIFSREEMKQRAPKIFIFDRSALILLLAPLLKAFSAARYLDERSPIAGLQGEQVCSNKVSLRCDWQHPQHRGAYFDDAGLPSRTITLLEGGVVTDVVVNHITAAREGLDPSGHGVWIGDKFDELPRFPVMEGGEETLSTLFEATASGVYIAKISLIDTLDPLSLSSEFLIEEGAVIGDGQPAGSLPPNTRLRVKLFDLLSAIQGMTETRKAAGAVLPILKVNDGAVLRLF